MLGINPTASDDEIKKAYRRLAMKYHPDKVEGMGEEVKKQAEAQFRKINEAYETLKALRGIK
ncbi:MAG: DnaJ domain-containing protein [Bacteroidales bacterium]|nr:DnaJ domain-containing protein [Bacteroidales bacterium]